MPKDYQISQYDEPINVDGWLELPDGHRVGIERAHLEEDTGKTTHVGGGGRIHEAGHSLVDYNRAGVPLTEIVSRPDIRSVDQARQYVSELRSILLAIGASDAKMEEGSLRVDANVSVRRAGEDVYGTRCEIKNMNSLRSLGRAIEHEARRQVDLLESGQPVHQETRHWDEEDGRTHTLRSKEEAFDYRYFPEPDLVPVDPGAEWVEAVDAALPALPAERRRRLAEVAAVDPAGVALVVERGLDPLVIAAVAAGADPARALTHAEQNLAVDDPAKIAFDGAAFAALITMETAGELTATQAKTVLAEMVEGGGTPAEIAAAHGFEAMEAGALEGAVDQAISDNPDEWARFAGGEDKLTGFFVGRVMQATRGQADGKAVTAILRQRRG
jgi:aspartyl-tRNA(Asn)/glutamyl-tRNA(Gln) amidotransferase subunit B